ncbi:CPBP family intramembrane glutamic endopeptidase [uncultured Dokdonia sp.]|uniref:CPBP family intramembrane glutamic endopeptidase n=1 Tax=uncultured Dokdonia sp. TaxID=575653 RepID=UPI00260E0AF9|nr:CPBP family intramembrane glutamic endopeptidase [uncultured Dokdonia sp.]
MFRKETFVHLLVGIIIGSFSVVFLLFIGKVTGILSVAVAAKIPSLSSLLLFAFKMFLVAVLEETFFRGYLFTNIYDGFKSETVTKKQAILIAVMLSSVLFGLAHIGTNNASLLSIIFLSINGMVWCIPFIITKNLGLSIGLHLSWNFAQTQIGFTMSGNKAVNSFYSIQNNGSDILTGGDYGPEAGIIGLVGFMMMLVLSITYLKLKQV